MLHASCDIPLTCYINYTNGNYQINNIASFINGAAINTLTFTIYNIINPSSDILSTQPFLFTTLDNAGFIIGKGNYTANIAFNTMNQ